MAETIDTVEGLRKRKSAELVERWCMANDMRKVGNGLYPGVIHANTLTDYSGSLISQTGRSAPHPCLLRGPLHGWPGVDDPSAESRK